jgi:molybdopterin synthase sulfur carrier subunit
MQVEIKLFGQFRPLLRETDGRLTLKVDEGTTVRDMLEKVKVPEAEVGMVSVNGELASMGTPLRNGDEVCVFSPVGGG